MAFLFGVPALLFLVVLVYGGLTGRVRMSSCCGVADPRKDLRMRGAFDEADSTGVGGRAGAATGSKARDDAPPADRCTT